MRALILIHRYLGITIGLIMALWCVSGIVMMYVGYPRLDTEARLRALEPIEWRHCCAFDQIAAQLDVEAVDTFDIEVVAGTPVLRLEQASGARQVFDLRSGQRIETFSDESAAAVAVRFAALQPASRTHSETLVRDQWTVSGAFNRDRPLHKVTLGDVRGMEVYVSSKTGAVVQHTTRVQRFWNWLGAVPHWLYPTTLRQHPRLWSQIVIWLSLAGVFLTAIGLYLGIDHWRAMQGVRLSPYRGVPLWHHVSGLCFGVLTLTWVGSGFVSMNPWGLFESSDFREERDQARDLWMDGAQIMSVLHALKERRLTATRIAAAPFGGKLYLLAYSGAQTRRLDAKTLAAAPLARWDVEHIAKTLAGASEFDIALLSTGDSYYYSGHEPRKFPVYRLELNDRERTRYYLDAVSGELIDKIDSNRRVYRWLFEGLHRFDFVAALRVRPWWDVLVLPLMLGVTVVCFTGVYMGYRRSVRR